jgi:hypothetical protein
MAISTIPPLDRTAPGFRAALDALFLTQIPAFQVEANRMALEMNAASAGGAYSMQFTFSSTTADADPGAGFLRLSNATQNLATVLRVDLSDALGVVQTSALDAMVAGTSTVKGFFRIMRAGDATKWLMFSVTAVASPAGYRNFTVAPIGGSSASPFADGDSVILYFGRTGDKGDQGNQGNPGTNGVDGSTDAITYTFSTTITDADPGAGILRLSNATQNLSTVMRFDLTDQPGVDQTAALDAMDDSTNGIKGTIRVVKRGDPSKWLLFNLISIASPAGYRNMTVALVASSAANPFANNDLVCVNFSRAGDAGSLIRRTASIASSATPTPNADTTDMYIMTALATAPTFGAPTGTPIQGQQMMFRIKDNGTARALAYNAIYRQGLNLVFPSTTIANKTMYIGFIYNATDTKWDLVSVLDNI